MRVGLALLVAVGVLAGVSAASTAAPTASTVCYQLKGPYAKWLLPASVARAAGSANGGGDDMDGVRERYGLSAEGVGAVPPREVPGRTADAYGASSGRRSGASTPARRTASARPAASAATLKTFTLLETGPYSLTQIKQLAAAGRLPIR